MELNNIHDTTLFLMAHGIRFEAHSGHRNGNEGELRIAFLVHLGTRVRINFGDPRHGYRVSNIEDFEQEKLMAIHKNDFIKMVEEQAVSREWRREHAFLVPAAEASE